ncbi:conserved hypothetical protein [Nitrosopumilaceae archaeon]|nr:conserved hypothetical protein [Nitrosopumilaceae archaeon]
MNGGCECGICGHKSAADCVRDGCPCCINFHERSGPGRR